MLGLCATGPLAYKPVMEGKAVLFKKFAGIVVVDIIASLEPTFGAINLEYIKVPECFLSNEHCVNACEFPCFTMTSMAPSSSLPTPLPTG